MFSALCLYAIKIAVQHGIYVFERNFRITLSIDQVIQPSFECGIFQPDISCLLFD